MRYTHKFLLAALSLGMLAGCNTANFDSLAENIKTKSSFYSELENAEKYNYSPENIEKAPQSLIDNNLSSKKPDIEGVLVYLIDSIYGSSTPYPWAFKKPLPADVVTLPQYNYLYALLLYKSAQYAPARATKTQLNGILTHALYAAVRYDLVGTIDASRCVDSETVLPYVLDRSSMLLAVLTKGLTQYKYKHLTKLIEGAENAALQYEKALPPRKPNTLICLSGKNKSAALTSQNNWDMLREKQISDFKERYNMLISTYKSGKF